MSAHSIRKTIVLCAAILLISAVTSAQSVEKPTLIISGEVSKPLNLTLDDLVKLPQTKLKAKGHDNAEHEYSGVALVELLKVAGVTLGGQLRGENLIKYVLVTAADNYQVLYALPEIDPEFTNEVVLLATFVDGKPLPKGEGPFRLVHPADKKHARWIREIKSIKVQLARG
jgi:DMSO/TMAO reductase YedYZ molybdopterin-dependent catalytic subunit